MFEEFHFEGRAMVALERLNLGVGFTIFSHSDFAEFTDNLYYYGSALRSFASIPARWRVRWRSTRRLPLPMLPRLLGSAGSR